MKHIFIIAIAILFSKTSLGQTWGDSSLKKGPLFYSVEVAPKFPGGLNGYYHFLAENLKMPENRFAKFSRKTVIVRIIIDKTGKVVFSEIEKGINENYNLAAIEMTKIMPSWSPALQNKYPVPVSLSLPIFFVD